MNVYVARYEHKHGSDIRIFRAKLSALQWQQSIAWEWWETEFTDAPKPLELEACSQQYWARMADSDKESFEITKQELE